MKRILTIIWVAAAMQGVHVANLHAQDNDFGLDFSVGAEKKIRRGMDFGLEAEARSVCHLRHLNSLNTVGFKEMFAYFDGDITFDEAVEQIKRNTRRYAKKQLTWFSRDSSIRWFHPNNLSSSLSLP